MVFHGKRQDDGARGKESEIVEAATMMMAGKQVAGCSDRRTTDDDAVKHSATRRL